MPGRFKRSGTLAGMAVEHSVVRPANEIDVPVIVDMMAQYYREDGYPFDASAALACAHALLADERLGWLWVIEDASAAAGYLAVTLGFSFEYRGRDAFIDELYLKPEARGRGLGRRALEVAESTCRAAGVTTLHLEVETGKPRARLLYERAGFSSSERALMSKRLR